MTGLLSVWRNWRERRDVLRAIKRQQPEERERNRFKVKYLLQEALAVMDLNDYKKAAAIWTDTRERYPAEVRASLLSVDVLLKLRRYDEADELMRAGVKKHPGDVGFAKGWARVALERGDFDAAIERYAAMRKRFPGSAEGFVFASQALAARGRIAEADALAERAMAQFPDDVRGFLEYGRLAVHREDWPEAMRRWQVVQAAFDNWSFGPMGRAQALIKLGRYEEADEVLMAARVRFPTESGILAELARCAQARGDLAEAARRWKSRVQRMPMEVHGYRNAAEALEEMGEYADAEAIMRAGIERFPLDDGPLIGLAKFLNRRQDFNREAEAWATLRQTFSGNEESYTRGAEALRRAGRFEEAAALVEEHKIRFKAINDGIRH